jgi:uncharacterized membrane protein
VETTVDILLFVAVVGAAVVAGGQLFCWVALVNALPHLPTEESAHVHQEAMTDRPHHFLRAFAAATLVACVAILAVEHDFGYDAMLFTLAGLLAQLVNTYLSARYEWPINDEIKSWGRGPVPDRYAQLRADWDRRHRIRTVASTLSLLLLVVAAILYAG